MDFKSNQIIIDARALLVLNELPKNWSKMIMLLNLGPLSMNTVMVPSFLERHFFSKAFHQGSNWFSYSHVSLCNSSKKNWKLIRWDSVAEWYFQSLMLYTDIVTRNSIFFRWESITNWNFDKSHASLYYSSQKWDFFPVSVEFWLHFFKTHVP